MKTHLPLVLLFGSLLGCAGGQLNKEYREVRGYSESEMAEIQKYKDDYVRLLARSRVSRPSLAYGASGPSTAEKLTAEGRVRQIFCTCWKKLGTKCKQKPTALTGEDRVLWAKSNAAESALIAMAANDMQFDASTSTAKIDEAECP